MKNKYYVAYSWSGKLQSGFGNIDIETNSEVMTLEVVKKIKAEIIKQNGGGVSVTILNIMKMEA